MDRADWLRITAAFGLALVNSESTIADVKDMFISAHEAIVVETATDHSGVNLDPMNVGAMLSLPYVEGTRPKATKQTATNASATVVDTLSAPTPDDSYRPVTAPAPAYLRSATFRGIKRYMS